MLELIDNLIQLVVTVIGCVWSGVVFSKTHKQPFFLLSSFYGVFALAMIYWNLHLFLSSETPPIFYVSDTGWVASYTFMLTLVFSMRSPSQKQHKTALCWFAPAFCIPQFILYITHGDVFFNLLMCTITMLIAWFAIQGLVFALRNTDHKNTTSFYISVLCFVALEYCLWTSSCFWMGDSLLNPYFWFDFLLSAAMLSLMPKLKKAVAK